MADLGEEDRARQLSQRVSETDEESTAKVHYQGSISLFQKQYLEWRRTAVTVGESGKESAKNHDETSHSNGKLSAKVISHVGTAPLLVCAKYAGCQESNVREWETGDAANLVD
ncbi:unnamed protein product [Fusarium graminearum]|nr:unnamed protein product [Fusarium graminearum]